MTKAALLTLLGFLTLGLSSAQASDLRPDDQVVFNLASEGWVTTKTAQVDLSVEAAVTGQTTDSTLRAAMQNAINSAAKSDWRLIAFTRSQDQTGLERWSATYQTRLPETELAGIQDKVKRVSKPGMQVKVANIAFTPTLDETEAAEADLRTQLYKKANEQLTALNNALPGRSFRIGLIDFSKESAPFARPMLAMNKLAMTAGAPSGEAEQSGLERAQKIVVHAHVVMMALPPVQK